MCKVNCFLYCNIKFKFFKVDKRKKVFSWRGSMDKLRVVILDFWNLFFNVNVGGVRYVL